MLTMARPPRLQSIYQLFKIALSERTVDTHSNGGISADTTTRKHSFDVIAVLSEVSDHRISPVEGHVGQWIMIRRSYVYIFARKSIKQTKKQTNKQQVNSWTYKGR